MSEITIDLVAGADRRDVTSDDVAKNIAAIRRAVDGKGRAHDFVLILDTISILEGIQRRVQNERNS